MALIDTSYLGANLRFLASDELEGREATTRGEQLASEFIAAQLHSYGVQPFGDSGTYFQNFPLERSTFDTSSMATAMSTGGMTVATFRMGKDFYLGRDGYGPIDTTLPMVFVGYGITADEFRYDDYTNVDTRGRVVLMAAGEPESDDTSYFAGPEDTRYSSVFSKARNARSHGAAAVVMVTKTIQSTSWTEAGTMYNTPRIGLPSASRTDTSAIVPVLYVGDQSMAELLRGERLSYNEVLNAHRSRAPLPAFALEKTLHLALHPMQATVVHSRNVIGLINGNDARLKGEFVAISAHYDHVGIRGREIYNGADDDGSGTVAVLEIARAFAGSNANNRSILVIFHAAEEKGLLGSRYLTEHAPFIGQIDALINMDMVGRQHLDSIHCIGSDKLSTDLDRIVKTANDRTVKFQFDYRFNDPNDPNRYYYRSDHYNYAKKRIPVVFFFDYMTDDYHKPTDTVEKINFEKIRKVATLTYHIALEVANRPRRLIVDKNPG
jgi:hypothetical protein